MRTTAARVRPILFSGPMVRAILDGTKTQTRRVMMTPQPLGEGPSHALPGVKVLRIPRKNGDDFSVHRSRESLAQECPYGAVGDRLWVRETHAIVPRTAYAASEGVQQVLRPDDGHDAAVFREGWDRSSPGRWRPSIHMPRWASRITLELTSVRAERLREISGIGAVAEGIPLDFPGGHHGAFRRAKAAYRDLWDRLNAPRGYSWAANPFVWVIEFRRVDA